MKKALIGGLAALVIGLTTAPVASAELDPRIPQPPFWCPGNGPGISASGYGGYCEGRSYPDGTRWNVFRIGYFWNPLRCIIPDGSMNPPLAPLSTASEF